MALGFTGPSIDTMQDTVKVNGIWVPAPSDLVVFSSNKVTSAQGSLFASFLNIGALAGALSGAAVSGRLGCKGAIAVQALGFAMSSLLTGIADAFVLLLLARTLLGVVIGLCTATVPAYINEVAPARLRGAFGTVFQLAIVSGIMLSSLLGGFAFVVDHEGHEFCNWRYLAYGMIAPSFLLIIVAALMPESPNWLANNGKVHEALSSLARLQGVSASDLSEEVRARYLVVASPVSFEGERPATPTSTISRMTSVSSFASRSITSSLSSGSRTAGQFWSHRKPFSVGVVLMLIQQFSGINAVIFFQGTILQDAGIENPAVMSFWVMTLQLVVTMISVPLIDAAGRKALLVVSAAGMMICCAGMVLFFWTLGPGWLAVTCSLAYVAFFSIGLGPIPWLMMGELFPHEIRSGASSLAAAVNWSCSFITTQTVGQFKEAMGFIGVFGSYAAVLLLGVVYIVVLVPETKEKKTKSPRSAAQFDAESGSVAADSQRRRSVSMDVTIGRKTNCV
eukprot:TRINITY_DN2373_c1_g1_i1.p1 TRINITY_DN2373_c1_g1~~TRINITY_DN2373_c1_g1_i1.p1  ORF type:complete len:566 (-),score=104.53 TRINITY_DN2373_c1_g1_i1:61-1581(-)